MIPYNDVVAEYEAFNKTEQPVSPGSADEASPETTTPPLSEKSSNHEDAPEDPEDDGQPRKRNCGHTGPTSDIGRAISSRNATRHGMCSKTLILSNECEEDWLELLAAWCKQYGNPPEKEIIYTFIYKTAQAEWFRLRAQREYDFFFGFQRSMPMCSWNADQRKDHDLALRYKTAAERLFQREYNLLEKHYKTHVLPLMQEEDEEEEQQQQPPPLPRLCDHRWVNNETGESRDAQGNFYPPPPNWVATPIVPGEYPPNHPANWQPPPPPNKKKKNKKKRRYPW